MIPIVAIEIEAPAPPAALQDVLLEACSASLTHLDCLPAAEAKGRNPTAVAMISNPEPDIIVIELADATRGTWLNRRLAFDASDPLAERWRTVGFSVGSLLGDSDRPPQAKPGSDATAQESTTSSEAQAPVSVAVSLGSVTGVGLDREAWRTGAELGLWASFWSAGDPYLSVGYAGGLDAPEDVRLRFLDVAAGVSWQWPKSGMWSARVKLLVDVQNQAVSATDPMTGDTQERALWVPGVRLGLDGVWSFFPRWALVLKLDGLVQDGATTINYGGDRVGAVPSRSLISGLALQFEP